MASFEALPKMEAKTEEETRGFKVEDKRRVNLEEIEKQIKEEKEEIEKKKFDSMTPEQREEWEYNRDKERGFTVKDKRRFTDQTVDIEEFKKKRVEEDKAKLETLREAIKPPDSEPKVMPQAESSPQTSPLTPEIYAWKDRLEAWQNDFNKPEKELVSVKNRGNILFEYPGALKELSAFSAKFEDFAKKEILETTSPARREHLNKEFSAIRQRIFNLKIEFDRWGKDADKTRHPLRALKKFFGSK